MKFAKALGTVVAASAGALLYGALVEVNRLELTRRTLILADWPEALRGFRIGLIADLHLRDHGTLQLTQRAVDILLDEMPDMVVIAGDLVSCWTPKSEALLRQALDPLLMMDGNVVAIPGNRDYYGADASNLVPVLDHLNIHLLRNESWTHQGITWLGIDSANVGEADPIGAMETIEGPEPVIALWHEPDLVEWLPEGCALMLSGHSHGGQFTTPWGWAPIRSRNGSKYLRGFFPDAPTPLYVSRGLGTTGPPSRLFCRPEVTILTLK
ncbi:MAG: metallophosphoesterase [Chthonomonas sp.]|nr:metallophosphoesterase [Chthonomonas sp.]